MRNVREYCFRERVVLAQNSCDEDLKLNNPGH